MTTESQNELNARHAELTELAKRNVCKRCGSLLEVIWSGHWCLWCSKCCKSGWEDMIKPKPTPDEIIADRTRKQEEAAKEPPRYNVDELLKEM